MNSAAGPAMRFTRHTYNPYVQEGQSVHEWETVGEAKVTIQALASKAKHTKLLLASNSYKAIGLEISGNNSDYLFYLRSRAELRHSLEGCVDVEAHDL